MSEEMNLGLTEKEKQQVQNLANTITSSYSDEMLEYLHVLLHVELRERDLIRDK